MDRYFRIGNFYFRIFGEENVYIPKNFLLFEVPQDNNQEFTFYLHIVEELPTINEKIHARRSDLIVYKIKDEEARLISTKGQDGAYALYREISNQGADIYLVADEMESLHYDSVFTSLFAMERQMIKRQSLILHCAYMKYQGRAVLFSAPSETGKSTQADLWERYRGSHTVNGDRALLRKIDGIWNACGWPVCGSSGICQKGDFPIHAIVMLRQGKLNHVDRLTGMQAFSQIYSQITINQWNREFVMKAMELLDDLIKQIPIWRLDCNMTEDAVQCLESALFPDGTN
ncbi:MAG: hypothetical protein Q4G15_13280 [Lachnospiraceae bacterium]|nr:hypothetical protein [Lachnospiraceae bacterium]